MGKPYFYMDEIPDRVWRTEFCSTSTGVATFLLPQLGRLAGAEALQDRGPSECCLAMALCYGVPLWAGSINRTVVEEVWAVQQSFGMKDASFVPFWEQREWTVSDSTVRLSYWRQPGRRLLVLTNPGAAACAVQIRLVTERPGVEYLPGWKADDLSVTAGAPADRHRQERRLLRVTLPDGSRRARVTPSPAAWLLQDGQRAPARTGVGGPGRLGRPRRQPAHRPGQRGSGTAPPPRRASPRKAPGDGRQYGRAAPGVAGAAGEPESC